MSVIKKLLPYIRPDMEYFWYATIFSFIWGSFCMINQSVLGHAIDDIFANFEIRGIVHIDNLKTLLLLLGSSLITWLSTYYSFVFAGKLSTSVSKHLRSKVFDVLQTQSNKFYDENSIGDLLTKSTSDIDEACQFFHDCSFYIGIVIGEFIFCLYLLISIDWLLALICLSSVPLNWIVSNSFRKKLTPISLESRTILSENNRLIQENLEGAKITRVFFASPRKIYEFDKNNHILKHSLQTVAKYQAGGSPLVWLITSITQVILLIIGGKFVIEDRISIGALVTVIMLSRWMFAPINNAATLIIRYGSYKPSLQRVYDLLHSVPEIQNHSTLQLNSVDNKGEIVFENVTFGFEKESILKEINLKIPDSSTIAILGATGSGKSSLINLIPRYYDVNTGEVKIDGINIKDFNLDSLRRCIGFVDQETFLFSKTIRENIAFGNPEASQDEIEEVARIAQIHDYIESLPDGYNTIVGERGITLSGGQRQRISIARTLLGKPLIVVLDDSLSAVDVATEKEIQKALEVFIKNQTTIIVTQRLSMTSQVDKCIILKNGEIAEEGTHEELLNKEGLYAKLYASQVDGIMDLAIIGGSA